MINIKSFLKSNKKFIDIFEFEGVIKDSDYIDGAIDLEINYGHILQAD